MNFTRKQLILAAVIGGAVTAVGTLFNWVTVSGGAGWTGYTQLGTLSVSGVDHGKGIGVLLLGLVGGLAALLVHLGKAGTVVKQLNETQHLWVAVGALGLALLLVLTVFFSGAYETHEVMGQKYGASRGFGLWLSLLGSLGGAVAAFMTVKGTNPMGAPKPPAA
jgi:hypothetical protein